MSHSIVIELANDLLGFWFKGFVNRYPWYLVIDNFKKVLIPLLWKIYKSVKKSIVFFFFFPIKNL